MKIDGSTYAAGQAAVKVADSTTKTKDTSAKSKDDLQTISKSEGYAILSQQDQLTISTLMGDSDKNLQSLRSIVTDMLHRQGIELDKIKPGQKVTVDDQAKAEASKMIADDGPLGVEKTADRIFQFAKAISGGDTSKLATLKDAITAGYKAAEKAMGGTLPDISKKTIDLVNSKLDAWSAEAKTTASSTV